MTIVWFTGAVLGLLWSLASQILSFVYMVRFVGEPSMDNLVGVAAFSASGFVALERGKRMLGYAERKNEL